MMVPIIPEWVLLHVPHASTHVPESVRNQFICGDEVLERELILMTDHHTDWLFAEVASADQVVRSPVSRLVVDVERFPEDAEEPMAARGMGAIYSSTSDLAPLRRELESVERQGLMDEWYWPHHRAFESSISQVLDRHGRVLILDCHSFPSAPLPYELDQTANRPEICIGTDGFHTPASLSSGFRDCLACQGFIVDFNSPFAGSIVPMRYYHADPRVQSMMIEVRRDQYLNETTGELLPSAAAMRQMILEATLGAIQMEAQESKK